MSRSRSYVFTHNNYTQEAEAQIQNLACRYIVYGREIAPTTQTPHLQGYVYFDNAKTLSAVIKLLPGSHIESAKGSPLQNYTYCTKEKDFFEKGIRPDSPPQDYANCKTYSQVLKLKFDETNKITPRTEKPTVQWYYGRSGTGKSYTAYKSSDDIYSKNSSRWWDQYTGQNTVIIDDFEPPEPKSPAFRDFLKLIDRYPYLVEYKGGTCQFNSPNIIITTEHHPEYHYSDNELKQILRRIDIVKKFRTKDLNKILPPVAKIKPL